MSKSAKNTHIPKSPATIWLVCCLVALVISCSEQTSSLSDQGAERLPLGLYKVVDRECSYAPDAPEDCTKTQYLELVKGVFYGFNENDVAFVTWLSEDPMQEHDYVARDLKGGGFVNAHEFMVKADLAGKEWFIVDNGTISDYHFVRNARETSNGQMNGKSHLVLKRAIRSAEIDHLLPYPSSGE